MMKNHASWWDENIRRCTWISVFVFCLVFWGAVLRSVLALFSH